MTRLRLPLLPPILYLSLQLHTASQFRNFDSQSSALQPYVVSFFSCFPLSSLQKQPAPLFMSGGYGLGDRMKKFKFGNRPNTASPSPAPLQTQQGQASGANNNMGRPPSYSGHYQNTPPPVLQPLNSNQRPTSPMPPPAGAPYPHGPGHVGPPLGPGQQMMAPQHQGIPPSLNPGLPAYPPYGQHPPRNDAMQPPTAPVPAAVARPVEVEGTNRSKAQLIVGIDFVRSNLHWAFLII